MDSFKPPSSSNGSNDIFSLSDQVLSDSLQFIEEIGFGNWGSVWLCRPKSTSRSGVLSTVSDQKIAVKLVHRSKTSTTAARVRSLWNEMKIVRSFKSDPHPSIIPFHSFIITPSYALITMAYLPTLVPVEVDEIKAREWFRFLLSGVEFLHKRGVVHNDIKPANILLSPKNVPVLVDFGFAEKYDVQSCEAFHSNLSYGTPEYLSPERARGLPHDTRKSDVWSLGITFFEILIGRTPFEQTDGEQFTTKEDLEKYWERTLRGKWVGSWKMSPEMEKMLRRMIAPNADLRCTATQAMVDPYWQYPKGPSVSHRRSSSYTSSIVFEKDILRLMGTPPPLPKTMPPATPPGLEHVVMSTKDNKVPTLARAKSQPKVAATKQGPRKRAPIADLSPIKASPPSSPLSSSAGKANIMRFNALASNATRKPLGAVNTNTTSRQPTLVAQTSSDMKEKRRGRALGDLTANKNKENTGDVSRRDAVAKGKAKAIDHVRDRVKEWERERERLREMSRLEEMDKEQDQMLELEEEEISTQKVEIIKKADNDSDKENRLSASFAPSSLTSPVSSTVTLDSSEPPHTANTSNLNGFRHRIRRSIDKTMRFYKTSGQASGRTTPALVLTPDPEEGMSQRAIHTMESWEDDILLQAAPSTLPIVRQAALDERVAADARVDRMTIWMRNVEKVVEDARQTFASSSTHQLVTLPSLPVAPLSSSISSNHTNRSSRLPRKILAANQIFATENDQSSMDVSRVMNPNVSAERSSDGPSRLQVPGMHTPSRPRRATVSTCSPEKSLETTNPFLETGSPSKRREKSRSHGNIFQRHIASLSVIEAELNKEEVPTSSHRLSQVLDTSLFIAPPRSSSVSLHPSHNTSDISIGPNDPSLNDLTSSPFHVEPYPSRKTDISDAHLPDSPSQRRLEGVYDRFLMATSGVKRLGKGYQSDNVGPLSNNLGVSCAPKYNNHRAFHSTRRPMPPPVSSADPIRAVCVDELGVMNYDTRPSTAGSGGQTVLKDENNTTVALVRRAIKAIVPGKTTRRLSRMV